MNNIPDNITHYSLTQLAKLTGVNENILRTWKAAGWLTGLQLSTLRSKYTLADFNRAKAYHQASKIEDSLPKRTPVKSTSKAESWADVKAWAKKMNYI